MARGLLVEEDDFATKYLEERIDIYISYHITKFVTQMAGAMMMMMMKWKAFGKKSHQSVRKGSRAGGREDRDSFGFIIHTCTKSWITFTYL